MLGSLSAATSSAARARSSMGSGRRTRVSKSARMDSGSDMVAERSLFPPRTRAALHRRLLAWYRARRRDLPWRTTRDPYHIWVSEVMLQQTQVATATPYYRAFIGRFPSVDHLASAAES